MLNDQKDSLDGSKANNTSLIFLVDFTFKGVGLALWNPGFRVSLYSTFRLIILAI